MKRVLCARRSPLFFRLLTIVCTIVVSSYVLFDYLDLDGSNWPAAQYPGSGEYFVVTAPIEIKPVSLPQLHERWEPVRDQFAITLQGPTAFLVMSQKRMSGLEASRHRSYRVALPRSSISDPAALA
jgi:hypothetical protein